MLQYLKWLGNLLQGDMARSFQWNEEVTTLVAQRLALNPIISSIGGLLPTIVSGATLTSIVLSLPTIGPLLLRALQAQDMYLAGTMVMLLNALAMIGTLVSDLLLVTIDPRIRFENEARA